MDSSIFESICQKLETSTIGVQNVIKTFFPEIHIEQFYRELRSSEKSRERYARSKEIQCELMADEILDIADDGSNDFMTVVKGDEEYERENKEVTNRSRLRVDSRKWLLSKLMPKKYGDQVEVKHSGLPTPPTELRVIIDKVGDNAAG